MTDSRKILKYGDELTASMPGIALDFRAEIVEIRKGEDHRSRVCLRALEPVLGYSTPDVLYEVGSIIWLNMVPPDGFVFDDVVGDTTLPL